MQDPAPKPLLLTLRVKPRAKRAALLGWRGEALKVAVRSAPEHGRANEELLALLTAALGLPTAALQIVAGAGSPDKRVRVSGLTSEELQRRIDVALARGVD